MRLRMAGDAGPASAALLGAEARQVDRHAALRATPWGPCETEVVAAEVPPWRNPATPMHPRSHAPHPQADTGGAWQNGRRSASTSVEAPTVPDTEARRGCVGGNVGGLPCGLIAPTTTRRMEVPGASPWDPTATWKHHPLRVTVATWAPYSKLTLSVHNASATTVHSMKRERFDQHVWSATIGGGGRGETLTYSLTAVGHHAAHSATHTHRLHGPVAVLVDHELFGPRSSWWGWSKRIMGWAQTAQTAATAAAAVQCAMRSVVESHTAVEHAIWCAVAAIQDVVPYAVIRLVDLGHAFQRCCDSDLAAEAALLLVFTLLTRERLPQTAVEVCPAGSPGDSYGLSCALVRLTAKLNGAVGVADVESAVTHATPPYFCDGDHAQAFTSSLWQVDTWTREGVAPSASGLPLPRLKEMHDTMPSMFNAAVAVTEKTCERGAIRFEEGSGVTLHGQVTHTICVLQCLPCASLATAPGMWDVRHPSVYPEAGVRQGPVCTPGSTVLLQAVTASVDEFCARVWPDVEWCVAAAAVVVLVAAPTSVDPTEPSERLLRELGGRTNMTAVQRALHARSLTLPLTGRDPPLILMADCVVVRGFNSYGFHTLCLNDTLPGKPLPHPTLSLGLEAYVHKHRGLPTLERLSACLADPHTIVKCLAVDGVACCNLVYHHHATHDVRWVAEALLLLAARNSAGPLPPEELPLRSVLEKSPALEPPIPSCLLLRDLLATALHTRELLGSKLSWSQCIHALVWYASVGGRPEDECTTPAVSVIQGYATCDTGLRSLSTVLRSVGRVADGLPAAWSVALVGWVFQAMSAGGFLLSELCEMARRCSYDAPYHRELHATVAAKLRSLHLECQCQPVRASVWNKFTEVSSKSCHDLFHDVLAECKVALPSALAITWLGSLSSKSQLSDSTWAVVVVSLGSTVVTVASVGDWLGAFRSAVSRGMCSAEEGSVLAVRGLLRALRATPLTSAFLPLYLFGEDPLMQPSQAMLVDALRHCHCHAGDTAGDLLCGAVQQLRDAPEMAGGPPPCRAMADMLLQRLLSTGSGEQQQSLVDALGQLLATRHSSARQLVAHAVTVMWDRLRMDEHGTTLNSVLTLLRRGDFTTVLQTIGIAFAATSDTPRQCVEWRIRLKECFGMPLWDVTLQKLQQVAESDAALEKLTSAMGLGDTNFLQGVRDALRDASAAVGQVREFGPLLQLLATCMPKVIRQLDAEMCLSDAVYTTDAQPLRALIACRDRVRAFVDSLGGGVKRLQRVASAPVGLALLHHYLAVQHFEEEKDSFGACVSAALRDLQRVLGIGEQPMVKAEVEKALAVMQAASLRIHDGPAALEILFGDEVQDIAGAVRDAEERFNIVAQHQRLEQLRVSVLSPGGVLEQLQFHCASNNKDEELDALQEMPPPTGAMTTVQLRDRLDEMQGYFEGQPLHMVAAFLELMHAVGRCGSVWNFFVTREWAVQRDGTGFSASFSRKTEALLSQLGRSDMDVIETFRQGGFFVAMLITLRPTETLSKLVSSVTSSERFQQEVQRGASAPVTLFASLSVVQQNMQYITRLYATGLSAMEATWQQLQALESPFNILVAAECGDLCITYADEKTGRVEELRHAAVCDLELRLGFLLHEDPSVTPQIERLLAVLGDAREKGVVIGKLCRSGHPEYLRGTVVSFEVRGGTAVRCEGMDLLALEQRLTDWLAHVEEAADRNPVLSRMDTSMALRVAVKVAAEPEGSHPSCLALWMSHLAPWASLETLRPALLPLVRRGGVVNWVELLDHIRQLLPEPPETEAVSTSNSGCNLLYTCEPEHEQLLLALCHLYLDRAPEPHEVVWCDTSFVEVELEAVLKRAERLPQSRVVLVRCEALRLQEQGKLLRYFLRKGCAANVHCIACGEFLLRSAQAVRTVSPEEAAREVDARATLGHWVCDRRHTARVECFVGPAGSGKTYQVRKRLQAASHRCEIVVHDVLDAQRAVEQLCDGLLQADGQPLLIAVRCSVGHHVASGTAKVWNRLVDDLNRFLFDLLVMHLIRDRATGAYVCIPSFAECTVVVELPDITQVVECNGAPPDEGIMAFFPILRYVASAQGNARDSPFELDDAAKYVAKYLKARQTGTIGHLYSSPVPASVCFVLDRWRPNAGDPPKEWTASLTSEIFSKALSPEDHVGFVVASHVLKKMPLGHWADLHRCRSQTFATQADQGYAGNMWAAVEEGIEMLLAADVNRMNRWLVVLANGVLKGQPCKVANLLRTADGAAIRVVFIAVNLPRDDVEAIRSACIRDEERGDAMIPVAGEVRDGIHNAWVAVRQRLQQAKQLMVSRKIEEDGEAMTEAEYRQYLFAGMKPETHPEWTRLHMRMWIQYMWRRCRLLASSGQFNRNTSYAEFGKTTMDVMLVEVEEIVSGTVVGNACAADHMVFYERIVKDSDGKDVADATWNLLPAGGDEQSAESGQLRASLEYFGMFMPTEVDLEDQGRCVLETYLAKALQLPLPNMVPELSPALRPFDFHLGSLPVLDEHQFVLTHGLLVKMLNIHERVRCRMPCVLLGETGVGKTALTTMLFTLIQRSTGERGPLTAAIQGCPDSASALTHIAEHVGVTHGRRDLGLREHAQIICDNHAPIRQLLLKELAANPLLDPLAVCSEACVRCVDDGDNAVELLLWFAEHARGDESQRSAFVLINVHASMAPEAIVAKSSWQECDRLLRCLTTAQDAVRQLENLHVATNRAGADRVGRAASAVSLWNLLRALKVFAFLISGTHRPFVEMLLPTDAKQRKEARWEDAMLLAVATTYYVALGQNQANGAHDDRMEFLQRMQHAGENRVEQLLEVALERLTQHTVAGAGIAMTRGLQEIVLMSQLKVLSGVPLLVVGPPGSSKTLGVTITCDNVRGCNAADDVYQKIPAMAAVHYRCSRNTTSSHIEDILARAHELGTPPGSPPGNASIPFVLMDKAELPEEGWDCSSLRVLQYQLEDHPAADPPVALVAIANDVPDATKRNRCALLMCAKPSLTELLAMCRSYMKRGGKHAKNGHCTFMLAGQALPLPILSPDPSGTGLLELLCKAYQVCVSGGQHPMTHTPAPRSFVGFHGLRDLMNVTHLLERLSRPGKGRSRRVERQHLVHALQRNLGGRAREETSALLDFFLSFFDIAPIPPANPIELLLRALHELQTTERDAAGRYLMVIDTTRNDAVLRLLVPLLSAAAPRFEQVRLSDFPDDTARQQAYLLGNICRALERGGVVVASRIGVISENLSELYNLHLKKYENVVNGKQKVEYHTNISVGAHSRRCLVAMGTVFVLHMTLAELQCAPSAVLSRFEKHRVSMGDVLQHYLRLGRGKGSYALVKDVLWPLSRHLNHFVECLGNHALYGVVPGESIPSVLLRVVQELHTEEDVVACVTGLASRDADYCVAVRAELGGAKLPDLRCPETVRNALVGGPPDGLAMALVGQACLRLAVLQLLRVAVPELLLRCNVALPASVAALYVSADHLTLPVAQGGPKQIIYTRMGPRLLRLLHANGNGTAPLTLRHFSSFSHERDMVQTLRDHYRTAEKPLLIVFDVARHPIEQINFVRCKVDEVSGQICGNAVVALLLCISSSDLAAHHVYHTTPHEEWSYRFMDDIEPVGLLPWLQVAAGVHADMGELLREKVARWTPGAVGKLSGLFCDGSAPVEDTEAITRVLDAALDDGATVREVLCELFVQMWRGGRGHFDALREEVHRMIRAHAVSACTESLAETVTGSLTHMFTKYLAAGLACVPELLHHPSSATVLEEKWAARWVRFQLRASQTPSLDSLQGPLLRIDVSGSKGSRFPSFSKVHQLLRGVAEDVVGQLGRRHAHGAEKMGKALRRMEELLLVSTDPVAAPFLEAWWDCEMQGEGEDAMTAYLTAFVGAHVTRRQSAPSPAVLRWLVSDAPTMRVGAAMAYAAIRYASNPGGFVHAVHHMEQMASLGPSVSVSASDSLSVCGCGSKEMTLAMLHHHYTALQHSTCDLAALQQWAAVAGQARFDSLGRLEPEASGVVDVMQLVLTLMRTGSTEVLDSAILAVPDLAVDDRIACVADYARYGRLNGPRWKGTEQVLVEVVTVAASDPAPSLPFLVEQLTHLWASPDAPLWRCRTFRDWVQVLANGELERLLLCTEDDNTEALGNGIPSVRACVAAHVGQRLTVALCGLAWQQLVRYVPQDDLDGTLELLESLEKDDDAEPRKCRQIAITAVRVRLVQCIARGPVAGGLASEAPSDRLTARVAQFTSDPSWGVALWHALQRHLRDSQGQVEAQLEKAQQGMVAGGMDPEHPMATWLEAVRHTEDASDPPCEWLDYEDVRSAADEALVRSMRAQRLMSLLWVVSDLFEVQEVLADLATRGTADLRDDVMGMTVGSIMTSPAMGTTMAAYRKTWASVCAAVGGGVLRECIERRLATGGEDGHSVLHADLTLGELLTVVHAGGTSRGLLQRILMALAEEFNSVSSAVTSTVRMVDLRDLAPMAAQTWAADLLASQQTLKMDLGTLTNVIAEELEAQARRAAVDGGLLFVGSMQLGGHRSEGAATRVAEQLALLHEELVRLPVDLLRARCRTIHVAMPASEAPADNVTFTALFHSLQLTDVKDLIHLMEVFAGDDVIASCYAERPVVTLGDLLGRAYPGREPAAALALWWGAANQGQELYLLRLPVTLVPQLLEYLHRQIREGGCVFATRDLGLKEKLPAAVGEAIDDALGHQAAPDVVALEQVLIEQESLLAAFTTDSLCQVLAQRYESTSSMLQHFPALAALLNAVAKVALNGDFQLRCAHYVGLRAALRRWHQHHSVVAHGAAVTWSWPFQSVVSSTTPLPAQHGSSTAAVEHAAALRPGYLDPPAASVTEEEGGVVQQLLEREQRLRHFRGRALLRNLLRARAVKQVFERGATPQSRKDLADHIHRASEASEHFRSCLDQLDRSKRSLELLHAAHELWVRIDPSAPSSALMKEYHRRKSERRRMLQPATILAALQHALEQRPVSVDDLQAALDNAKVTGAPSLADTILRAQTVIQELAAAAGAARRLAGKPLGADADITLVLQNAAILGLEADLVKHIQALRKETDIFCERLLYHWRDNAAVEHFLSRTSEWMAASPSRVPVNLAEAQQLLYAALCPQATPGATTTAVDGALEKLSKSPLAQWDLSGLLLAVAWSSETHLPYYEEDALDALLKYVEMLSTGGSDAPCDVVALLVSARLLGRDDTVFRQACLLRCSHVATVSAMLTTVECGSLAAWDAKLLGEDPSTSQPSAVRNSAKDEWCRFSEICRVNCPEMDELMDMIGLERTKWKVLEICQAVRNEQRVPHECRVPQSHNFAFLGSPGTGKTTVARLLGKMLFRFGVRTVNQVVETTGEELLRLGADEVSQKIISRAQDGVLFIDEAYALRPERSAAGSDVAMQLLRAAENNREHLSIIIAGYKDDIERSLMDFNIGFKRRFPHTVEFDNYTESELRAIFIQMAKQHNWDVADEASSVAASRLARRRGMRGFGNAGDVRTLVEAAYRRAVNRLGTTHDERVITLDDVMGPPPSADPSTDLGRALAELDAMTGLSAVKVAMQNIVSIAKANYERERRGERPVALQLNRVFLGNPGTGKTTVAKLYGRILKGLGLLSDGACELKQPKDLRGDHYGQTITKTSSLIDRCAGRVLVVDEAYTLDADAVNTLVSMVHGAPGEDIAVVLVGYETEIKEMFRTLNPGLGRRFDLRHAVVFVDMTSAELERVALMLARDNNVRLGLPARAALRRELEQQRCLPNFGNAGVVTSLIMRGVRQLRVRDPSARELTIEDLGLSERVCDLPEVLRSLAHLYGMDHIRQELTSLSAVIRQGVSEGRSPSEFVKCYVFTGNPGTGKTTVAQAMASMLCSLGCLRNDRVVSVTGLDLQGDYVGQTKTRVTEVMAQAQGGVLLIDEAYTLGGGFFAKEAVDQLVALITAPVHHRQTVVILAGYEAEMEKMLGGNAGLRSRFTGRLSFPDWGAEYSVNFMYFVMSQKGHLIDDDAKAPLQTLMESVMRRPGWGNARDCLTTIDLLYEAHAKRTAGSCGSGFCYTAEDVAAAEAKWNILRPPGVACHRDGASDLPLMFFPGECHRQERVRHAPPTSFDVMPSESPEKMLEADEAEQSSEARLEAVGGDEDAVFAALLDACVAAGYDASHERRKELVEILRGVQAGGSFPPEVMHHVMQQIPPRRHATVMEVLRPQVHIVLRGMPGAVAAEEQRLKELQRLADEMERQRREKEEAKVQQKLQTMSLCPAGFAWHREGNGWRCNGGSHFTILPYG